MIAERHCEVQARSGAKIKGAPRRIASRENAPSRLGWLPQDFKNSLTFAAIVSGLVTNARWPHPGNRARRTSGISSHSGCKLRCDTSTSRSPVKTSVGALNAAKLIFEIQLFHQTKAMRPSRSGRSARSAGRIQRANRVSRGRQTAS